MENAVFPNWNCCYKTHKENGGSYVLLKFIRLVLRPGTRLCDLIFVLIPEVITSTLHKSVRMTCELSFGKSEPRICIHLCYTHIARYVGLYLD